MGGLSVLKNPSELFSLLKETYSDWSEDKASQLAAALAYYTAFSIAPLLLISIVVAGFVFGERAAQGEVFSQLEGVLGPEAAGVIQTSIANSRQTGAGSIAAIVGIATLVWSASNLFAQLQDALNSVWEVKPDPQAGWMAFIKRRFLSMTMVLGIAFVLLVSLVLSAGLSAVGNFLSDLLPGGATVWQALNFVLSFAIVTGLFAAIYKVLPDVTIAWSDVWIGAAVTALLFAVGKLLIGLYLGHASVGSTFGAAGSLLVFLVWVYYSAQILFFGAEFTQVYARKYGSRIEPAPGAVRADEVPRLKQGPHSAQRESQRESRSEQQREPRRELVGAGAAPRSNDGHDGTGNGSYRTGDHRNGNHDGYANGHATIVTPQAGGTRRARRQAQAGAPSNGDSGGTKGAPDAVKKLMWAGLVSGSLAVGAVAARRASSEIWRGVFGQDPPTKNV